MYKKESFIIQMQRVATAAATFVVQTQPWQHGAIITIQGVAVVNHDSNNKDFTVGVTRYGNDMYIETIDARQAGEWMWWDGTITIPSDYRVIVRLISPALGDRYTINVFGYMETCVDEVASDG